MSSFGVAQQKILHAKDLLSFAKPLLSLGIALHRLHPKSKRPVGDLWSTAPRLDFEQFKAVVRDGDNIGVRLGEWSKTEAGYLHLIDLDIRDPAKRAEAWATLVELWPDVRDFPCVVSGSRGESRHFYFFADEPWASRKIFHSKTFSMVWDSVRKKDVKKWDWEIELFGTGKQAVLPPSIHPDTGLPYRWERELDFGSFDLGLYPTVDAETLGRWGAWKDESPADDDDDLLAIHLATPMGLSEKEVTALLADLPLEDWCEDRDGWLNAGMALHHEFEGSEVGFGLWDRFSQQSEKYDAKDIKRVWKSFGDYRGRPVRMATLKKAAAIARLENEHDTVEDIDLGLDEEPDLDLDLGLDLGEPGLPATMISKVVPKPFDPQWKSYLALTEDGAIKATLHNIKLIIRNDVRTRGIIGYNAFTQEVTLVGTPGTFRLAKESPKPVQQLDGTIWSIRDQINGDLWSDSHDNAIRLVIEAPARQGGYALKVSDRDLRAAIDIVAHENTFHPVRDYLLGLEWDGVPRAERLFIDYLGTEDTPYHRMTAAMFLIGAVARVFEPGHKFDFVPILEGLQGKRKSTFVSTLAVNESWFAEIEGDFHDAKGMVEKMQGAWILELPELQGFSKHEVTTIKGFISRRKDKVRLAYAKRASEFHRQCVFIGSTNEDEYLRDETGNRRFWPIQCNVDQIDTNLLKENVSQIWAEAVAMYAEMRRRQTFDSLPLYLSDDAAREEAEMRQEGSRIETQEELLAGEIEAWLNQPAKDTTGFDEEDGDGKPRYRNETCVKEVWIEMLGRDSASLIQRESVRVGKALKLVPGWYKAGSARTEKYGKQRVFRRSGVTFLD